MAYKIEWTNDALEDAENIIYYLLQQWSYKIAKEFEEKLLARLETLTGKPHTGIISSANNEIRSIVVTRRNKLYYRIKNQAIVVLNIFDTRQNPTKNKFEKGA